MKRRKWYLTCQSYDNNKIIPRITCFKPKFYLKKFEEDTSYSFDEFFDVLIHDYKYIYVDGFGCERFTDKAIKEFL